MSQYVYSHMCCIKESILHLKGPQEMFFRDLFFFLQQIGFQNKLN
jgi:hypothetical protein